LWPLPKWVPHSVPVKGAVCCRHKKLHVGGSLTQRPSRPRPRKLCGTRPCVRLSNEDQRSTTWRRRHVPPDSFGATWYCAILVHPHHPTRSRITGLLPGFGDRCSCLWMSIENERPASHHHSATAVQLSVQPWPDSELSFASPSSPLTAASIFSGVS
jgi:hypothetical protein